MDVSRILQCLNNIGIYIDDSEKNSSVFLEDIIEDSLAFIMFVAEVEQEFKIEIPDEFLNPSTLGSIEDFQRKIYEMIS